MKKYFTHLLLFGILTISINDSYAQRRGTKKRTDKSSINQQNSNSEYSSPSLMDKLNFEIKPGNLFVSNTGTDIALKFNVGYKIDKTLSAGIGGKLNYTWVRCFNGSSSSGFDYGFLTYVRAKVSNQIYFVGEYNMMSLDDLLCSNTSTRTNLNYPTVGLGYVQPGLKWSYGAELLFVLNDTARDELTGPLEYWISFSYNF